MGEEEAAAVTVLGARWVRHRRATDDHLSSTLCRTAKVATRRTLNQCGHDLPFFPLLLLPLPPLLLVILMLVLLLLLCPGACRT